MNDEIYNTLLSLTIIGLKWFLQPIQNFKARLFDCSVGKKIFLSRTNHGYIRLKMGVAAFELVVGGKRLHYLITFTLN